MKFSYFFRFIEDPAAPRVPVLTLVLFMIALFLIARNMKRPKTFAGIAIGLQTVMLIWYFKAGLLLIDGLPLYHCRIAIWVVSIGLLLDKKSKFIVWISILSVPASLLVLLVRDMDHFAFPHITNFYYFLGHGMIFLIAISYIDFYYADLTFKDTAFYTLSVHISVYFINILFGSNYAYVTKVPFIGDKIPSWLSFTIITMVIIGMVTTMQKILEGTDFVNFLKLRNQEVLDKTKS